MNFKLALIDYLVIFVYLCLMLSVGWIFSRLIKGGKDFFIGGRRIPWWVAGISLYMSLFSAWTFTGAASFTYNTGWFGVLNFAMWPLAMLIGFLITARLWRRTRSTSSVEYVRTRFNKATHVFLSIIVIVSTMFWPAHHLASLSKICAPALFPNSMVAIDVMIVVVGIIILLYTFSGGSCGERGCGPVWHIYIYLDGSKRYLQRRFHLLHQLSKTSPAGPPTFLFAPSSLLG